MKAYLEIIDGVLVQWGEPWGWREQAYGDGLMDASRAMEQCANLSRSMAFFRDNPGENLAFVAARRGVALFPPRRDFWHWTQYILFIPRGQRGGRVNVMMRIATCQGEALRSVEVEAARD